MIYLIIYIDKTISDYYSKIDFTEEEKVFFNQLAIAHKKGDCLLCGNLSSIQTLMNKTDDLISSVYKKILNKHSETRSIIDFVDRVIVLSCGETTEIPDFISKIALVLKVDQVICDNFNIDAPCTLIGENLHDCEFYRMLAERYIVINHIRGTSIACHFESGGGNTTNKIYEKCIKEDKVLTICIVDSDKKYFETRLYPNQPSKGDTVNQLIKTHENLIKEISPSTYAYYCIPTHEVENLIPLCVLENMPKNKIKEGINSLKKLLNNKNYDAILVYDLKKGEQSCSHAPQIAYWKEVGNKIHDNTFPKVGDDLLEPALELMRDQSNEKCYFEKIVLDDYLKKIWGEIEKFVFSWCCASYPIRS